MSEYSSRTESPDLPPALDAVCASIASSDVDVRMAYSKYLEKPSPSRMEVVLEKEDRLTENFGFLLRKLLQDRSDLLDFSEVPKITAAILHEIATDHSRTLADYVPTIELPDESTAQSARQELIDELEDSLYESAGCFVDVSINALGKLIELDMEVLNFRAMNVANSPVTRFKERAVIESLQISKVIASAAIGAYIANRLSRRIACEVDTSP